MSQFEQLLSGIREYKRKYYYDRILKGALLSLFALLSLYLLLATLEYFGNFDTNIRAVLFFSFIATSVYLLVSRIAIPIYELANLDKKLTDEEAAHQIGKFFPEIDDKLLNTLQLQKNSEQSALIAASIAQRSKQLGIVRFSEAINLNRNVKWLRYVAIPAAIILIGLIFIPQFFTESTARIINYNKKYVPQAPFSFELQNKNLYAYQNEDYEIQLKINGNALPDNVFLVMGNRRLKMTGNAQGEYSFLVSSVQNPIQFYFEAAGFDSENYKIELRSRPSLTGFNAQLIYPNYLNKKTDYLKNTGNLTVPAGTTIKWSFDGYSTDSLQLSTEIDLQKINAKLEKDNVFVVEKKFLQSSYYTVQLKNKYAQNKENIRYFVDVVPDQYPKISLEAFKDTVLFDYLLLGGNISDDYGLTRLVLHYNVNKDGKPTEWKSIPIPFNNSQSSQSYYYEWSLRKMGIEPGSSITYYTEVWDNDGVQGAKNTKSVQFNFRIPTQKELEKELNSASNKTEQQLDQTQNKAEELRKEIEQARKKMLSKKSMDWQDKKVVEDLIKKQKELEKAIQEMQKENQLNNEKRDKFSEQSEKLKEKTQALQELMNELLDEETKRLYEELQRLLDEKAPPEALQKMMEQVEKKEMNLEKELDRALEMFKQLKFERKMEETIDKLNKLAEKQEKLADKTEQNDKNKLDEKLDKNEKTDKSDKKDKSDEKSDSKDKNEKGDKNDKSNEKNDKPDNKNEKTDDKAGKNDKNTPNKDDLLKEQQELKEQFDDLKKDLDNLREMNQDMKQPNEMPDTKQQEQQISQEQQNSSEQMQKNNNKKAAQSQKKAAEQMQQMSQKMQQSMAAAEKEEMEEDMEALRALLENLLKLSFDQEDLMKDFRNINQSDPKYVPLGQKQLKLSDDAKIIEDSLYALAKRVFQIKSFVTREVSAMKEYMEQSTEEVKQRRPSVASGKQQLAMTSMNNLALMLSDVLKQMQEQMASQMEGMQSCSKPKKGNKKKGQNGMPQMSQLQKELGEKIQQLKESGKSGRELSEELAKLAAQQEAIRKMLQDAMKKEKGNPGKQGSSGEMGEILKQLEKNEEDLVNKRLTSELIQRQKEITTRMLEVEKSVRERDLDEQRKAETAQEIKRNTPPDFQQYIQQKNTQIESLKSVSPAFTPFYRQESQNYFNRLGN
jgi:hypothetical protein